MMTLKKLTISHLQDFLQNVRPLDIQEAEMGGVRFADTPLEELEECRCLVDENDNVYAIGGVEPIPDTDNVGAVWMLCTHRVEEHPIRFLKASKELLDFYLHAYKILANRAWLGNDLHIKWLTWMGANWQHKTPNDQCQYFYFQRKETPK